MAPDTAARQLTLGTTTLDVSDYAMQHPEHYGLQATTWKAGRVVDVDLTLMDADGNFIDENGCNCDLDSPCNNPVCVMSEVTDV